jgi:hypothetical protein
MFNQRLAILSFEPDMDLNVMRRHQTPPGSRKKTVTLFVDRGHVATVSPPGLGENVSINMRGAFLPADAEIVR